MISIYQIKRRWQFFPQVTKTKSLHIICQLIQLIWQPHQKFSVLAMSENVSKLANDAKTLIIPSPRLFQIGVKYLTWVNPDGSIDSTQANNLTAAIQGFLTEFERYAILGLEYNDERVGLMDYFNGTNDYVDSGLELYTFSPNMVEQYGSNEGALNAMRSELNDLFVKGIY